MTQVSKRLLNKNIEARVYKIFSSTIRKLQKDDEVENFLDDLLSPTEKLMLSKRLAIAILLLRQWRYQDISDILKVTFTTIAKVQMWLKSQGKGFNKALEMLEKEEKVEKLIDGIEELWLTLEGPRLYGSVAFKRRQETGKKNHRRFRDRQVL